MTKPKTFDLISTDKKRFVLFKKVDSLKNSLTIFITFYAFSGINTKVCNIMDQTFVMIKLNCPGAGTEVSFLLLFNKNHFIKFYKHELPSSGAKNARWYDIERFTAAVFGRKRQPYRPPQFSSSINNLDNTYSTSALTPFYSWLSFSGELTVPRTFCKKEREMVFSPLLCLGTSIHLAISASESLISVLLIPYLLKIGRYLIYFHKMCLSERSKKALSNCSIDCESKIYEFAELKRVLTILYRSRGDSLNFLTSPKIAR